MRTLALTVAALLLLLAAAVAATATGRADEGNPEPTSGRSLKSLQGKWQSVARIIGGLERPYALASYSFDRDKVTYAIGKKGISRPMTARLDPKRADVVDLTDDQTKAITKYFYKVDKGRLYMAPDNSGGDPNAKADFTGNAGLVLVFEKQQK
jgi:hypothetical protein